MIAFRTCYSCLICSKKLPDMHEDHLVEAGPMATAVLRAWQAKFQEVLLLHDPCRYRSVEKCQVFLSFENPRSACCIEIHKRLHMFETGLVFCHKATRYV